MDASSISMATPPLKLMVFTDPDILGGPKTVLASPAFGLTLSAASVPENHMTSLSRFGRWPVASVLLTTLVEPVYGPVDVTVTSAGFSTR
jgi:hypothetical protein